MTKYLFQTVQSKSVEILNLQIPVLTNAIEWVPVGYSLLYLLICEYWCCIQHLKFNFV